MAWQVDDASGKRDMGWITLTFLLSRTSDGSEVVALLILRFCSTDWTCEC